VAFDITKALGDADGNEIKVGQILSFTVGGQGDNPIPTGLDLHTIFGNAGTIFGNIGNDLGGLKQALEEALRTVINALTDPTSANLEEIYKGFVTLVAKAFAQACKAIFEGVKAAVDDFDRNAINDIASAFKRLWDAFVNAINKVSDEVWEALSKAWRDFIVALKKFFDHVLQVFLSELNAFENLPGPLKCGTRHVVGSLRQTVSLLLKVDANAQVNLEARVDAVIKSLQQLFKLVVGSASAEGRFLFGRLFDRLDELLRALIRGDFAADPGRLWTDFVLQEIVFSKDLVLGLIDAIANGKLWAWFELPCSLGPGQLNDWLNNGDFYEGDIAIQREFRIRLVSALDAFARAKLDDPNLPALQTEIDLTDTPYVVAGLISVVFDTLLNFVFEPACFVVFDEDLDGIEDLGVKLGVTLSRQIRVSIRAMISGLLRGFSFWSVRNEVLIELVGSILGSLFAGLIEGVVRNLTWTFRVVTCYHGALEHDARVLFRWDSLEVVEGTTDRLQFLLLLRQPTATQPDQINEQEFGQVLGLFKDLGAYIDISYRRFRFENRFPAIVDADTVTILSADIRGRSLFITATTSASFDLPQPVLRAYFCCSVAVMRPGHDPSQSYSLQVDSVPDFPRIREVTVLSNRGGVATARVSRS
jgi:hypothetical protein